MTSLLSAKKRAEEFAAAVDGGADPAGLRPELADLVGVVSTLQREAASGEHLAPRPEFTATLRERLMVEAVTSLPQDTVLTLPTRRKGSRERRLALVASSLVIVGGTAGMAAAAQNALPGEALYPIKRGLEKAEAGLATSQTARAQDLLDAADSRLVEVQGLFDASDDLSRVSPTIDDFTTQALEASALLLDEFEETRDPAIIDELNTFAAENLDLLQELAKTAPAEHQDELAMAADALMRIDQQARAACPTCADGLDALKMPTLFLTAVEAQDAMDAVQRVRLNNDHPVITDGGKTKPDVDKGEGDGKDPQPPADEDDVSEEPGDTDPPEDPDAPGAPDLPGNIETDGPSGGKELGEKIDETAGGAVGDVGGEVKDALPEDLDPLVDTLVP
jgi:Domain of unknown function (DUF5667)